MPSTSPDQAASPPGGLLALLLGIVEEGRALVVRLLAYLSGIAMLALIATDLVCAPPGRDATMPPVPAGWMTASRPHPAFAVNTSDFTNKTESYEILRHPQGGRKDTVRWMTDADPTPVAELEIYRIGDEPAATAGPATELARRMGLDPATAPEMAGLIQTKFGKVPLWTLPGAAPNCLGFAKTFEKAFETPHLQLSGWSCQADSRAAQRSLIGCTLDRLILLSAGNDPKLAELFAHAELQRGNCGTAPTVAADWVNSAEIPPLRGRL